MDKTNHLHSDQSLLSQNIWSLLPTENQTNFRQLWLGHIFQNLSVERKPILRVQTLRKNLSNCSPMIFSKTKAFDMFWGVKNMNQSDTQGILNFTKFFKTENIHNTYQKPVYHLEDAY